MPAPSKAEQEAEARNRAEAGIQPGETTADALDVVDDSTSGGLPPVSAQPPAAGEETPAAPAPRPNKRDEIISRFRADRTQREQEERDDISEFARTNGMPPEFQEPAAPEPAPAAEAEDQPVAEAAPAAQPKIKLKVRGQDTELPLDEVIAKAQIALAADNYLDEAKGKLTEVDALLRQTRANAPRAGEDGKHPAGHQSAQPPATDPALAAPAPGDPQHPEDDQIVKLIETIQFGDPAEAQSLLRNTIAQEVAKAVPQVVSSNLQSSRLQDEGARTAKVLKDFEDAHAELASDPLARAAIERRVYDIQVEDIAKLGVDPATIANGAPAAIAEAHRFYRANGYSVRSPSDMLQTATDDFLKWKGVGKTEPTPATKGEPRIEVDRTARRQAIPQQPSRTAAPRPAVAQPSSQPRDRSSIVQGMRQARMAPRNRVAG